MRVLFVSHPVQLFFQTGGFGLPQIEVGVKAHTYINVCLCAFTHLSKMCCLLHLPFQRHAVIRSTSIHRSCQASLPLGRPAVVTPACIYHKSCITTAWCDEQWLNPKYLFCLLMHICPHVSCGQTEGFLCCITQWMQSLYHLFQLVFLLL